MRKFFTVLVTAFVLVASGTETFAQGDLNIFGYFQSEFREDFETETTLDPSNSFSLQQLNLFAQKDLGDQFSAFVNFELTSNFSSHRNWGAFNIEEAWFRYNVSDELSIKAGLLIPTFNNLNEVKNRTPLLPYVSRPLVYEKTLQEVVEIGAYVPERAYLQVYGNIPAGSANIDYSVFVGDAGTDYINSAVGTGERGLDTSSFLSVGGRIGMRVSNLKFGVSGTYDREKFTGNLPLGNVPRIRLGGDLSYSLAGFTLSGEAILVSYSLNDPAQEIFDAASNVGFVGEEPDKTFYFVTLLYDIDEDLFVYGTYTSVFDGTNLFINQGIGAYFAGFGFRPTDSVVLKAQYLNAFVVDPTIADFTLSRLYLAGSVIF